MNGQYLRLSPDELAHAIADPDWAYDFVSALDEAIDDAEDAGPDWAGADPAFAALRRLETGKAWSAIGYLLDRHGFEVGVVLGESEFTDEDWGYGPPRYLAPGRVAQAAVALTHLPFGELAAGVDSASLARAGVYPLIPDEPLDWVGEHYAQLTSYFAAAARDGHGMLVWLD